MDQWCPVHVLVSVFEIDGPTASCVDSMGATVHCIHLVNASVHWISHHDHHLFHRHEGSDHVMTHVTSMGATDAIAAYTPSGHVMGHQHHQHFLLPRHHSPLTAGTVDDGVQRGSTVLVKWPLEYVIRHSGSISSLSPPVPLGRHTTSSRPSLNAGMPWTATEDGPGLWLLSTLMWILWMLMLWLCFLQSFLNINLMCIDITL